jgi:hypothetical protein
MVKTSSNSVVYVSSQSAIIECTKENQPADAVARHRYQTVRQGARQRKANRRLLSVEGISFTSTHQPHCASRSAMKSIGWHLLLCQQHLISLRTQARKLCRQRLSISPVRSA